MGAVVKISVIIPHYKRAALLEKTLLEYAISNDVGFLEKEVEFIVIDDSGNSDAGFWAAIERIRRFKFMNIRAFSIDEGTHNLVIPMNFGIRQAQGEYVLFSHAECAPVTGYILSRAYERMSENDFITLACYSLTKDSPTRFMAHDWPENLLPRPACFDGDEGWYNHSRYNPRALYFAGCINRKVLVAMGGLDEDYANAHSYDDDDFRDRCIKHGLKVSIADDLVYVHQWHYADSTRWQTPEGREQGRVLYEAKKNGPAVRNVGREWGTPKKGIWQDGRLV
jgi:glycosyltransferase involved in cell wall biosynthesis